MHGVKGPFATAWQAGDLVPETWTKGDLTPEAWSPANLQVEKAFDPSEPRDERGRWAAAEYAGPKKSVRAYKQMIYRNGKLYTLYHGKSDPVPMGKWLKAEDLLGTGQANRPAWYSAPIPSGKQFWQKETGTIQGKRVWVAVDLPADYVHKEQPVGTPNPVGHYRFQHAGRDWYMSGGIRLHHIMGDAEVSRTLERKGLSELIPHEQHQRLSFRSLVKFDPEEPRDEHGRWVGTGGEASVEAIDNRLKKAGMTVDGLLVNHHMPGIGSIGSNLSEYYTELKGVRQVPLSDFINSGQPHFYTNPEEAKTRAIAETIRTTGKIDPVIVVYPQHDLKSGPYIMQGVHNFDALRLLGKKTIPAVVLVDTEQVQKYDPEEPRNEHGEWTSDGLSAGPMSSRSVMVTTPWKDEPIEVLVNPIARDVRGLVHDDPEKMVRVLFDKHRNLYVFNSNDGIHGNTAKALARLGADFENTSITGGQEWAIAQRIHPGFQQQINQGLETAKLARVKKYDPEEPRDEHGQWTSAPGAMNPSHRDMLGASNRLRPVKGEPVFRYIQDPTTKDVYVASAAHVYHGGQASAIGVFREWGSLGGGKINTGFIYPDEFDEIRHAGGIKKWVQAQHAAAIAAAQEEDKKHPKRPAWEPRLRGNYIPARDPGHEFHEDARKYSADQPRDDHGRWVAEGFMPISGEAKHVQSVARALRSLPRNHREYLRHVKISVVDRHELDVSAQDKGVERSGAGLYNLRGNEIKIAPDVLASPTTTLMHEVGHAIDANTGGMLQSTLVRDSLTGEAHANLTKAEKTNIAYYISSPKEMAAELYSLTHAPEDRSARFFGGMTRERANEALPNTVREFNKWQSSVL